jgi:hypothetical protein
MFGKNPGTTAIAVISLAIAIGPNCALFSVVDNLLLKPPPVQGIAQIFVMSGPTGRANGKRPHIRPSRITRPRRVT